VSENRDLGLAPPSALGLRGRGFGGISAGGDSARVSVSVVSWGCGGAGRGPAAGSGGGSMEFAREVVGTWEREMEIEKPLSVVFVCELNPRTRGLQARSVTSPLGPIPIFS
jgi:hypothetical protein